MRESWCCFDFVPRCRVKDILVLRAESDDHGNEVEMIHYCSVYTNSNQRLVKCV